MLRDPNAPSAFRPRVELLEDRINPQATSTSLPIDPQILVTLAQSLNNSYTLMAQVQGQIGGQIKAMMTDAAAAATPPTNAQLGKVSLDYAYLAFYVELVQDFYLSIHIQGDALVSLMASKGYFGNANQQVAQAASSALSSIIQTYNLANNVENAMINSPPVSAPPVANIGANVWSVWYPQI